MHRLSTEQDGILSTADLRACGLDARAVRRRLDAGTLIRLHRGVYTPTGHRLTEHSRLRAGMLVAAGIADRSSAAFWHGLRRDLPPFLEATVPRNHRVPASNPFTMHPRRRRLDGADIVSIRGLLTTSVALTVLELADVHTLDDALRTRRTTLAELATTAGRYRHCHGLAAGRTLLASANGDTHSEAERRFRALLRAAGISGWHQQHRFERWWIDVAFPGRRIAIEIDGWAYHRSHERFANDAEKHTRLALAGWTLLRFTWQQITEQPAEVVRTLARALN
ncbi:hypothetical protein TPAU25S_00352 [Tsukamurella paurometabola]|uniref:DUF559 domain-containing protein n=1 Tax=Tsukamurella paurometabola (strain ATCC 8368 / DSM 20162 / CCUG 35730 / CIP 100753 / JCM 10117 / KCTC 9821 / NBRC 16120 / NCIMB 702349 / NCTC 13040) TaxID=521096 RepID=D5UW89_TSUPD|nr:type IV toxin-antitoxin system AbiEi family antitoxin domain-containing protein [Tsukamurella paurometabola]ADG79888.1 conserved hypothetical protein [Tsukamurella paurometabola DSM 20162]SUP37537.1 Protein of uncharacterised function (DUF559) [Tsukamurella paurometabola]